MDKGVVEEIQRSLDTAPGSVMVPSRPARPRRSGDDQEVIATADRSEALRIERRHNARWNRSIPASSPEGNDTG
jgi:hypothetical protein